jgi:hypothetical protein
LIWLQGYKHLVQVETDVRDEPPEEYLRVMGELGRVMVQGGDLVIMECDGVKSGELGSRELVPWLVEESGLRAGFTDYYEVPVKFPDYWMSYLTMKKG